MPVTGHEGDLRAHYVAHGPPDFDAGYRGLPLEASPAATAPALRSEHRRCARENQCQQDDERSPRTTAVLTVATLLVVGNVCGAAVGRAAASTSAPTTTRTSTTHVSKTSTSTTVLRTHLNEPQTVLSPIGLNVRAAPSKTARVIVTAAQGAVLQSLTYTNQGGGWYKVRGATVSGWVSANPAYSAPGRFGYYKSSAFSVLFPAGWSVSGSPHSGVTFQAHSTAEKVVITEASSVSASCRR